MSDSGQAGDQGFLAGRRIVERTVAGQRVMMFDGIPVRRTDAILNTESRVV
ncbi:phage major capsid protein [Burkholderia multivorans]|uniref:phage major capsid protein n=1 Tax=Burkholderia multivorans TaxID=87883 RepID=UPI0015896753|nr:hypothetical protein [Burkholderia multivorans]